MIIVGWRVWGRCAHQKGAFWIGVICATIIFIVKVISDLLLIHNIVSIIVDTIDSGFCLDAVFVLATGDFL
jgi:hypothetical protein